MAPSSPARPVEVEVEVAQWLAAVAVVGQLRLGGAQVGRMALARRLCAPDRSGRITTQQAITGTLVASLLRQMVPRLVGARLWAFAGGRKPEGRKEGRSHLAG